MLSFRQFLKETDGGFHPNAPTSAPGTGDPNPGSGGFPSDVPKTVPGTGDPKPGSGGFPPSRTPKADWFDDYLRALQLYWHNMRNNGRFGG